MRDKVPLSCLFSMNFSSERAGEVFKELSRVCGTLGLAALPGVRGFDPFAKVREKLEAAIDGSLVVVVDTSAFSWWVAFELWYALDQKICIPLIFDPGGRVLEGR